MDTDTDFFHLENSKADPVLLHGPYIASCHDCILNNAHYNRSDG
jgi:hypothetical protein